MRIPSRLAASSLLVLLALCGTSLAVAADTTNRKPIVQMPAPPLTSQAQPDLHVLDGATADLVQAARDTTGNLQALNLDAARAAISRGDDASARVSAAVQTLNMESVQVAAGTEMTVTWSHLRAQTSAVVSLLAGLQAHDSAVLNATAKGRAASWAAALDDLNDASAWLGQAQTARASLGTTAASDALGQLVDRDSSYDSALQALYSFMAKGHDQSGHRFTALSKAVAEAQAALPASDDVLSFIVGESAGATIYGDLLNLERSRSNVTAASSAAQ